MKFVNSKQPTTCDFHSQCTESTEIELHVQSPPLGRVDGAGREWKGLGAGSGGRGWERERERERERADHAETEAARKREREERESQHVENGAVRERERGDRDRETETEDRHAAKGAARRGSSC